MKPNKAVVYMVVGTLAFAVILYAVTLTLCAYHATTPPEDVLTAFKDLAIFASGALAALLARTGSHPEEPQDVNVINKPNEPVPTTDQP